MILWTIHTALCYLRMLMFPREKKDSGDGIGAVAINQGSGQITWS